MVEVFNRVLYGLGDKRVSKRATASQRGISKG